MSENTARAGYGTWILLLGALIGLAEAIFDYFYTGNGIHGTAGVVLPLGWNATVASRPPRPPAGTTTAGSAVASGGAAVRTGDVRDIGDNLAGVGWSRGRCMVGRLPDECKGSQGGNDGDELTQTWHIERREVPGADTPFPRRQPMQPAPSES